MIAINWGTSNFRAHKLDAEGNLVDERSSARGAVLVPAGGFRSALMAEVGDWIEEGERRVLMCGMVGARRGWKEAPYIPLPANFDQVREHVVSIDAEAFDARIVPGLIGEDESGVPEVLRGEETEIFGCGREGESSLQFCLPGTHTKWVRMEKANIVSFSTSMTGDLFRAIREKTILRSCTQQEPTDDEAFLSGVERSRQPGALQHQLFGVRTLVLTGKMKDTSGSSYLSGLLIGSEVKAMIRKDETVHLVGEPALCALYEKVLQAFETKATVEPPGAALRGLQRIARAITW
jgi:2-dehydro-3-deoxygalactonokinase